MSDFVISTLSALRTQLATQRARGLRVGVVPTMGALHEGHLSLVREGARQADVVVVTIFVNPTQFGKGEDFERYPRQLQQDAEMAMRAGATLIFAPPVEEMYPLGERTRVTVAGLTEGLCGAFRPGHFEGVTTVVSKLFNAVGPGTYFFGKKDYQQWRVIERMARDLLFDVTVVGMPIVRESDGLAMSSRNTYLSPEEREKALSLSRGLLRAKEAFAGGIRQPDDLIHIVREELDSAGVSIEYVEMREAKELGAVVLQPSPVDSSLMGSLLEVDWVLAVAARVGKTRLIDNVELQDSTRAMDERD